MSIEPAKRVTAVALQFIRGCRPLRGLYRFAWCDPGAYAPGFMLASAPRTRRI